jgi:imidazolonepropionase-like amidohydrolase
MWSQMRLRMRATTLPCMLTRGALLSLVAAGCTRSVVPVVERDRPASGVLAIVGVTVVDPSGTSERLPGQTVIVQNGRITAMGRSSAVAVPAGARRIDGTGRFLIPGLWDMHVHFMNAGVTALPTLVAHGVTSVREMGGFLDSTRAWQARMRNGSLIGPHIFTSGGMLENPRYLAGVRERDARLGGRLAPRVLPYRTGIAGEADARRVVDSLVALEVDFVKYRTVDSPASLFAIIRAAHRAGLKVAGHSPFVVSVDVAADSGLDDVEHALGILDTAVRGRVARTFAAHGTWYTPTLVVSRAVTFTGDSANAQIFGPRAGSDPRLAYASPWLLSWWRMQVDERMADTSTASNLAARRNLAASMQDIRAFAAAGVRILAGTDAGSVLIYPGFSLHEELALLVEAGLSPRQALWSATAGPAQFAGMADSVGSIAVGRVADLVLLDGDPLADIANTRRIRAVIQRGRAYGRATLDSLLAGVRARNAPR